MRGTSVFPTTIMSHQAGFEPIQKNLFWKLSNALRSKFGSTLVGGPSVPLCVCVLVSVSVHVCFSPFQEARLGELSKHALHLSQAYSAQKTT